MFISIKQKNIYVRCKVNILLCLVLSLSLSAANVMTNPRQTLFIIVVTIHLYGERQWLDFFSSSCWLSAQHYSSIVNLVVLAKPRCNVGVVIRWNPTKNDSLNHGNSLVCVISILPNTQPNHAMANAGCPTKWSNRKPKPNEKKPSEWSTKFPTRIDVVSPVTTWPRRVWSDWMLRTAVETWRWGRKSRSSASVTRTSAIELSRRIHSPLSSVSVVHCRCSFVTSVVDAHTLAILYKWMTPSQTWNERRWSSNVFYFSLERYH